MADYGMRGEAAGRLLKGKKGAPPPEEDDLGMPPEDEGMPPEEGGGAPPMDLASLLGAAGGGGAPPPEGAPMEEGGAAPQPMDLDSALGGVETALDGMPPEAAEEIRVHLNAIREIAANAGSAPPPGAGAPMPEAGPGGMPSPVGASPSEKEIAG